MILLQANRFDVIQNVVTTVGMISMPFVLVGAARWQVKKSEVVAAALATHGEEQAKAVAKTAVDAAEKVAQTVTTVATEANRKVDEISKQGVAIHTLVNSQKTELEAKNTVLESKNAALEARVAAQDSRIAALDAKLSSLARTPP